MKKCITKDNTIKIPRNFIINISIENNKNIFTKSFIELYKEFNLPPINIDEFINEGKCIKGKENYVRFILGSKISELYKLYIQSKRYKREVNIIKNISGIKMMLFFFVHFFKQSLMALKNLPLNFFKMLSIFDFLVNFICNFFLK